MSNIQKERYQKLVNNAKNRKTSPINGEWHHIFPSRLGGDDTEENLVKLTYREHFVAHWLLSRIYSKNQSMVYAFYAMANQNGVKYNSKAYERAKRFLSESGYWSKIHKDKVRIRDDNNKIQEVSREEYIKNWKGYFHTTGMCYVYDYQEDSFKYISSQDRKENPKRFVHIINFKDPEIPVFDYDLNQRYKIPRSHFRNLKNHGKNIKYDVYESEKRKKAIKENGEKMKDHISVLDREDGNTKLIKKNKYFENPDRYQTSSEGKYVKYDTIQERIRTVSQEELDQEPERYTSFQDNIVTAKDFDGNTVKISKQEFNQNSHKYQGLNKGRVNCISRDSGERLSLPKEDFDPEKHLGYAKDYLIPALKTPKQSRKKNIHILEAEYGKVDLSQYHWYDKEKFDKARSLLYNKKRN